ncbi:MAG: sigma-70 family RNA polymerase sigma factor [Candidatus Electryoneaceae bacterium]|nr:sigma-70 family RNA polymerase sigma factor [Candidatus Electryoneaceae bacterium]
MAGRTDVDCYQEVDLQFIRKSIKRMIHRIGWIDETADLEQDIWLYVLQRLPKHDPDKSDMQPFIILLIKHKIADMFKSWNGAKRSWHRAMVSLNDSIVDECGNTVERWECVDQSSHLGFYRSEQDRQDLKIDMDSVMSSLPEKLQFIATQLQERSITEISRQFGIPRSSLYNSIKRLRGMLEEAGISDYLSNS